MDHKDSKGVTAMHYAVSWNKLQIVQLLLQSGAARDAKDAYGATPLYLAVKKNHLNVAMYLIENEVSCSDKRYNHANN